MMYLKHIIDKMVGKNYKTSGESGFTVIEVLVTTFVFSIMITIISLIYIQVINDERRGFVAQKIQENGLYILELMSRELRVSQVQNQDSPNCTLTTLTFTHPVNGVITYSLTNGVLQRTAGGITTDLSSSDITFSRLNFCAVGSGPTDLQQSRVTILASIQNRTGKEILTFNLQTTVASRNVQTEFEQ